MRTRAILAFSAAALCAALAGCAAQADDATPGPGPSEAGATAADAVIDDLVPGQTIPASDLPASAHDWSSVGVVVAGDRSVASEIADDAEAAGASAEVFDGASGLDDALAAAPEVIVCAGGALLPDLESVTAQSLDQRFVLLGMQLLEPTENVVAVTWPGQDSLRADAAVPSERLGEALVAGLTASAAVSTEVVVDLGR